MWQQQAAFNRYILENRIIGFFQQPITLKSGRQSHFYVNWREATNDAFLLDQLTNFIVDYITAEGIPCDTLYGVPEGASKTAVIAAMKLARQADGFTKGSHVIAMGRAKPKEHGAPQDKYFIGMPRGRTVVLEDTTTTGGSLVKTLDTLTEAGVTVTHAIGLTDRMEKTDAGESVGEWINRRFQGRIRYTAMSHALALLPEAARRESPGTAVLQALTQEFAQHGVAPLKWEGL